MEPNTILSFTGGATALPIPATEPVLTLFDTLGPGHADGHALAREIWRLEAEGAQRVHLRINSAGGSVAQGYSLFSAIRHTRMEVHTWADGMALSMAGLIFLAGAQRHMAPWSMLMLHNPSLGTDGEAEEPGNALILERIRASVLKMYEGCTALEPGRLSHMMEAETWLTASDALALGLATDLAGQAAVPDLELALRARAEAGIAALQEAVLQVMTEIDSIPDAPLGAEADSVENQQKNPQSATDALESSLLSQLALIEAQLAALNRRMDEADAPPLLPAAEYTPLPGSATGFKRAEMTFREMERRDPKALDRLKIEDPARFDALFQAQYGQKGGRI